MRILIIGGTGLISTPITRFLIERGDDLTHFNRGQRAVRLPAGLKAPAVIVGNRQDFAAFEKQIAAAGQWDAVIDMCCYEPAEAESVIRAFKGRTKQFVFCSTVDAYAKPPRSFPIREDAPVAGLTTYGKKKAVIEGMMLDAHARGDFATTIIRPAQTYGEGGHLIDSFAWGTHFVDRIRKGLPIISHGDGQSLWVACHIDDVARAFVATLGNERAFGRAYHTTGEEWLTWDQYYAGIAKALGKATPELVHIPTDFLYQAMPVRARECLQNFQFNNIFDNSAARRDLGFRQSIPFVDGVRRTLGWLLDNNQLMKAEDAPHYDQIIRAWKEGAALLARTISRFDSR